MHVELLVEEPSAEAALQHLLPRLLPEDVSWEIRTFSGKTALLQELPNRLSAYPQWLPHLYGPQWCVVVLVDRDDDDCLQLKATLEHIIFRAGLVSRSGDRERYNALPRIAIEELEAWFFGDVPALRAAYPSVPETLAAKAPFRDPDDIRGGTWERLEKVLERTYPGGMPKVEVASNVAPYMDPDANRSHSFGVFRDAVREIGRRTHEGPHTE